MTPVPFARLTKMTPVPFARPLTKMTPVPFARPKDNVVQSIPRPGWPAGLRGQTRRDAADTTVAGFHADATGGRRRGSRTLCAKRLRLVVCLWAFGLAATLWASAAEPEADFVVAPDGSDAADGSAAAPFATLMRARDAVRPLRQRQPDRTITVLVRGGRYELDAALEFTPEDSGTAAGKTIYAAWPGERPVFCGGRIIRDWTADSDGVWRADVGRFRFEQLYVDGRRAERARTPNDFFFYARGQAPGAAPRDTRVGPDHIGRRAFRAYAEDLEPLRGLSPDQLRQVSVMVYNSWEVSRHRIKAANLETGLLEMTGPYFVPFFHFARPKYVLIDCPGALDQPGEWTRDADGTVAYIPWPGQSPEQSRFVAARLPHLLVFAGRSAAERVEHLELRGLSCQHSAYLLPDEGESSPQAASKISAAVMADYAANIVLTDCEVARTGNYAIWFRDGCWDCLVQRCKLTDLGAGGVRIGVCELERAQDPAHATGGITVDNCIIHDGGHIWKGAVGVFVAHSGDNRITHNDIAGLRYTGISLGWRWGYGEVPSQQNLVEHNRIHHLGDILSDMGGIYTLGEAPGTVLRGNVIHDIDGSGECHMRGIYNDNSTADLLMENNLVYNVRDGGYTLGSGRSNILRNNIFIGGRNGVCGFSLYYPERDRHLAVTVERNIFFVPPGNGPAIWFKGRYPDDFLRFERNLYFDPSGREIRLHGKTFAQWQAAGYDAGSVVADPRFLALGQHNYDLAEDSPARSLGFQPFDTSRAGVYGGADWIAKARERRFPPLRPDAPPPRPLRLAEDFENSDQAAFLLDAHVHDEGWEDAFRLSGDAPAGGDYCLAVRDKSGLEHSFNPHFFYKPDHWTGHTRVSFDLRLGSGARLQHQWREYPGRPHFHTGPSLHIVDNRLIAANRTLLTLPVGQWIRFEVQAGHGDDAQDTWRLTVTPRGKPPQTFDDLPVGSPGEYQRLTWLGFISAADADTIFWLDNLRIEPLPRQ